MSTQTEKPAWFAPSLNDLSDMIGFGPTAALCELYGRQRIYIPKEASKGHRLGQLFIGIGAGLGPLIALCAEYGDQQLTVPSTAGAKRLTEARRVATLVQASVSPVTIAELMGLPRTTVDDRIRDAVALGILPADLAPAPSKRSKSKAQNDKPELELSGD